jgi:regulator of RNase E activity RraA
VLVIEGVHGVSNIGGISAAIGKRQGEIGAVVDGGVRDVSECRAIGYPIWSRDVTPLTGKWRVQTVQINFPCR